MFSPTTDRGQTRDLSDLHLTQRHIISSPSTCAPLSCLATTNHKPLLWGVGVCPNTVCGSRPPRGWFGAKSGQYFFRHKTRKQPFGTLLNLVPVGWILLCESVRPGLTWALLTHRLSLDEVGAEMKQRVSKILQSAAHGSLVDTLHHKLTELQSDLSSTCKKGVQAARDATVAAGRRLRSVPASLQSLQRAGEAAKENMSLAAQRARQVLNEKWNAFQATKRDKKEM
jgi:hypothetical protein